MGKYFTNIIDGLDSKGVHIKDILEQLNNKSSKLENAMAVYGFTLLGNKIALIDPPSNIVLLSIMLPNIDKNGFRGDTNGEMKQIYNSLITRHMANILI